MAASGAKIRGTCSPVRDRCRSHRLLDRVTHSSNVPFGGKINKWPDRNWVLPCFFCGNVPFKRIGNTTILHDRNLFGEKKRSNVYHLAKSLDCGPVLCTNCARYVRSIRKAATAAKNKPTNCIDGVLNTATFLCESIVFSLQVSRK